MVDDGDAAPEASTRDGGEQPKRYRLEGLTGPPENRERYGVENRGSFKIGGVGVVYEAVLLEQCSGLPVGTRVGLKALTGVDQDRFTKLAQRSAILREHPHPNLAHHIESFIGPPVAIAAVREEDNNLFFTAHRWVEGTSLTDLMGGSSATEVLDWIGDVADAVDHLHGLPGGGIAHRDIHARNIIVDPDGRACLIDFDTLLWGEGTDTVLTSLASGPVLVPPAAAPSGHRRRRRETTDPDDNQGSPDAPYEARASQAQDRAMLALVLLKALGRVSEAADLQEVSDRCLAELSASTAAGSHIVATLQTYLREPPPTAAAILTTVRSLMASNPRTRRWFCTETRSLFRAAPPRQRAWGGVARAFNHRAALIAVLVAIAVVAFSLYNTVSKPSPRSPSSSSDTPGTTSEVERVPFRASAVAAGTSASCLTRKPDGSVWCWGRVPLLYESSDEVTLWSTPTPRRLLDPDGYPSKNVVAVAIGGSHRCALTAEGKVWCWGSDSAGQIGDGPGDYSTSTAVVVNIPGKVTKVVAAERSSCALTSGQVYCWGAIAERASVQAADSHLPAPRRIPGVINASDVSLSGRSGCAIMDATVKCWPLPTHASPSAPRLYTVRDATGTVLAPITNISLGQDIGCALGGDAGTLWCWGATFPGREPVKATGFRDSDVELANDVISGPATVFSDVSPASQVAVGDDHVCVLTTYSRVECLGSDDDGQLGALEDTADGTPVSVQGLERATSVSAGARHTCATLTNDTVECWGSASDGETGAQVSQGRPDATEAPLLLTIQVPPPHWVVKPGRVGALVAGMDAADAVTTGLVKPADPDTGCDVQWEEVPGLRESGVQTEFRDGSANALDSILVLDQDDGAPRPPLTTDGGIGVGTPVEELKLQYRESLVSLGPVDASSGLEGYVVFGPDGALIFSVADIGDGTEVTAMVVRAEKTVDELETPADRIC